jgi:hypothetical protein
MSNDGMEMPLKEAMNRLAIALDKILNGQDVLETGIRRTGFVLLLFPFNDATGNTNYISNGAERADIMKMFKEQVKHFEEQQAKH